MKIIIAVLVGTLFLVGCNSTKPPSEAPTRNVGERITDLGIERRILGQLGDVVGLANGNNRIAVDVFRGQVLLTGEVPTQEALDQIVHIAGTTDRVEVVHNRLKIAREPKSQSHTVHESYLKSKMQARLLRSDVKSTQYYLTVRDDLVYVMGTLTQGQFDEIDHAARQTSGILGLVSLAQLLLTEEEYQNYNQSTQSTSTAYNDPYNTQDPEYTQSYVQAPTYNAPAYTQAPSGQAPSYTPNIGQNPIMPNSQSPYIQLYQGTTNP